jgi:hypothetical protein
MKYQDGPEWIATAPPAHRRSKKANRILTAHGADTAG